jgi:VWFA-related protein
MNGYLGCAALVSPRAKKSAFRVAVPLFGLAILAASGQTPNNSGTATDKAAPSPSLSTNVDEVSLNMVVHDKRRKLVLDLKPEDVAITDNGTPVKLKELHLVSADQNNEHVVTFVFDNFGGAAAKDAQNVALKMVKALPSKGYSFATFGFMGRLRLIERFTDDRNAVTQSLKLVTDSSDVDRTQVIQLAASNTTVTRQGSKTNDRRIVASEKAEKDLITIARTGTDPSGARIDAKARARYQTILTALESARQIQQDQHTQPGLAGLLALVRSQQQISDRKCLVYFTARTPMDSNAKEMLHTIAEAANQAGETLYVVDMNALDVGGQHQIDAALGAENIAFNPSPQAVAGSGGMATSVPSQERGPSGPSSNVGMAVDWLRQSDPHPFAETKSPMAEMAAETGGAYIDAQDNVKRPLQQMVEDLTTYYQATYVPPISEYDGSFRTIATAPVRDGLSIKTKTGYFAVEPGAENGVRPFEAPLLKLLAQTELPGDVKFRATVLNFGELAEGNTSTVAVEVPIAGLKTRTDQHTNLFSAHVSIVAQVKDKSGAVIEHFAEDISRRGALELIDRDKSAVISLQRHFPATKGQYTLEVAVLDRFSDKAGVQRIDFEVPPDQTDLSLSDLVVVRKVDATHDGDDLQEPMRFEKSKVTANLSGDIPQSEKAVSLFFILHPDPKSKDPVTLEMVASRNGRAGKRMQLPLRIDPQQPTTPYLASFKSGLAPGDYEVKTTITQGGKTSVKQVAFTVEGDQRANDEAVASNVAPGAKGNDSAVADAMAAGPTGPSNSPLVITAITNPVSRPSQAEIDQLIVDARDRALHYVDSLPNFMCIEVTSRSVDSNGSGRWKQRDTISELLRYRDKKETRTMLEVNGKTQAADRANMEGAFSSGELGGVLKAVFLDTAKAEIDWKETDNLGNGTVQVFNYRVDQKNSVFSVVGKNDKQIMVGFHGQFFIDPAARNVRRVTLIADLPQDFPTHYTSIAVDYDYVLINSHDYLMPVSAELRLQQGRREAELNSIEFRNYKRFGSSMRIVTEPVPNQNP